MGFFKGLKEDIVQSVNELSDSLGDVLEEDETVTTIENPEQAQEELTEENVEEETIEETAIRPFTLYPCDIIYFTRYIIYPQLQNLLI